MNSDNIFHYCSVETFYQIITNKCIRLSDLNKTNDYMEKKWIVKFIEGTLKNELKKLEIDINLYEDYWYDDGIDNHMAYINSYIDNMICNSYPILISCFSKEKDKLSQWRAYGQDGYGVSIGFNYNMIKKLNEINRNFTVRDVIYKESKQIDKICSAIQDSVGYMGNMFSADEFKVTDNFNQYFTDEFDAFCEVFVDNLNTLCCYAKNPAFSEEREIRMVYDPHIYPQMDKVEAEDCYNKNVIINKFEIMSPRFYCKDSKIIACCDLNFKELLDDIISDIVLGPKCKLTYQDTINFLNSCGYSTNNINITNSVATYV